MMALDFATQLQEMKTIAGQPDFALGSVHAVTRDGALVIASASGSQLASYVWGAANVIFVIGAQKLVPTVEAARERIYEHSLKLEDAGPSSRHSSPRDRLAAAGLAAPRLGPLAVWARRAGGWRNPPSRLRSTRLGASTLLLGGGWRLVDDADEVAGLPVEPPCAGVAAAAPFGERRRIGSH